MTSIDLSCRLITPDPPEQLGDKQSPQFGPVSQSEGSLVGKQPNPLDQVLHPMSQNQRTLP